MKALIVSVLAIATVLTAGAQDKKTVASKLDQATVFFAGAELTHSASAALVKGENEINIEGLSPSIDLQSLKIKATGGAVVSASEFSVDYLSSAKAPAAALKKLEDSLEVCKAAIARTDVELKLNAEMSTMLSAGVNKNVSGSEKGLGVDELAKAMSYFKSRSGELYTERLGLDKKKADLQETQKRLQAQIQQETGRAGKTSGVLRLSLTCPSAVTSAFTVSYYTRSANWTPYYDVTIASTDKPITFAGKAKVVQTTGLDWNKVRLTLSTATPTNGKTAPLFSAWFLQQKVATRAKMADALSQNSYSYMAAAPQAEMQESVVNGLAGATPGVMVRGAASVKASTEPLYVIDGVPSTAAEASALDPQSIKSMEVLKDASATAVYGSRAAGGVILITLKDMGDYVRESDYEAPTLTYEIDLPYTIPGNGKAQNIDLQKKDAPAEYKYYCAPKLDAQTYLLAEISDWEKLGLLTGSANVTYDGNYVGQTVIDASSTREKLTLTLGTEKRIAVKREKLRDFSSVKALGSDIQQVFTYQITVRNNQNKPVLMVTKDQFPLSTRKDIEVVLNTKDTTPWTAKKDETGVITWEEQLDPGTTKTYRISYTVKYPKGMNLNL
ncbi:MAG: mucoidy inhibitor MuiA family protein [Rikenellaceae bacterium]|jgi:TonB-dependent SusC/RagA subfamily outer membrane receptor|nr:mucoidy inhibitor MuiA family protein [Rikenellaceae bacterium]